MATTRTVVLSTTPGRPTQSVTLTWSAPNNIAAAFDPPLHPSDSGPSNLVKQPGPSQYLRGVWTGSPVVVAGPNPGEVIREYGSLSDDQYTRMKLAEIGLRHENAPYTASALLAATDIAQQPRSVTVY